MWAGMAKHAEKREAAGGGKEDGGGGKEDGGGGKAAGGGARKELSGAGKEDGFTDGEYTRRRARQRIRRRRQHSGGEGGGDGRQQSGGEGQERCAICKGTTKWKHGLICEQHGRELRFCKECGGSGHCEQHARAAARPMQGLWRQRHLRAHGRRREQCKDCRCARAAVRMRREQCKDCHCARAAADAQEKAAAALAACGRTGGRDMQQWQRRS